MPASVYHLDREVLKYALAGPQYVLPGEPQKNPPYDFYWYYSNAWEFLYEILHDC